jgi:soluble lytic murein transglycosylase-like protein
MLRATLLAVAILCASAVPARAELVYFSSGRALAVKAIRSHGSNFILYLRSGGQIECDAALIAHVAPDQFEYPEDVLDALPFAKSIREAPAVPEQYRALVEAAAKKHGVDARLVGALIQVESAYHSKAISPKGAKGLMQLMPSTGRQYGALDLLDPKINVDTGVRHLKMLLSRYDLPLALAAYNAGEGAVDRFNGIPPFRETQHYVATILRLLNRS